jgi:Predicted exosome subunit
MMQGTFHWFRVQVFCYATEKEDLIHDSMVELLGTDEFDCDIAESEHGNRLIVLGAELTKQRTFEAIFKKIGKDVVAQVIDDLDNRVDDDCVFYLRLDKQKLVQGEYKIVHHGDVLSLTGKVVSHPARKEIATRNLLQFLSSLQFSD